MQSRGPTFYLETVMALLTRPGVFFTTRFAQVTVLQALIILTASGLFGAATGALIGTGQASPALGPILFINAVGMAVMGSALCYLALATTAGRRYSFRRLFTLFSLSSGAVMLVAWVPSAFLLTEPWKWWLIGTGMVKGLGMSKTRAAITVLMTFTGLVMLIYAIFTIAAHLSVRPV